MALIVFLVVAVSVTRVHMFHNHGPEQHVPEITYESLQDFDQDLENWKKSHNSGGKQAVRDIVDVAFSRLGLYDRAHHCERRIITEAFMKNNSHDNSTYILNGRHIYGLFHRILSMAIYLYSEPCCRPDKTAECLQPLQDPLKTMPLRDVFNLVRQRYNRHAFLGKIDEDERLKYELESYANRFQCIDEKSIVNAINDARIADEERKMQTLSTMIIYYVLKGYNFLGKDDVCPFTYIYSIYEHYGGRDKLSEREFMRLMHDLRGCQPRPSHPGSHVSQTGGQSGSGSGHNHNRRAVNTGRLKEKRRPIQNGGPFEGPGDIGSFETGDRFLNEDSQKYYSDHMLRNSEQCFDTHRLIGIFTERHGVPRDNIRMSLFMDMCPALLQQTLLPQWHKKHSSHRTTVVPAVPIPSTPSPSVPTVTVNSSHMDSWSTNGTTTAEKITRYKSYLYGSLSVLVISLCSLVGAVFMKLSRADVKTYMMGSMLSLGVGCLVADAALHLLPEVVLNEDDAENKDLVPGYLRKLCAFLVSIHAFFVLEMLLSIRHTHSHAMDTELEISPRYTKEENVISETNFTPNNRPEKAYNNQVSKTVNIDHDNNTATSTSSSHTHGASQADNTIQVLESRCSNASDRISIHDTKSGIKALAWMIIIGDGIHNFADGLAIGAAFALTFTKGISTSITVVCHELPHELGDFAVLVSTGMSIKRAMLLNFLSSLTAFAGLYVGLALGEQEEASKWIFAVGAGMFLYVALTDLVPECKEYFKKKCTVKMFFGQNCGILLGYATMLLLAIYEEKLEIKA